MVDNSLKFMKSAIREAEKCFEIDEVPVGCVIVKDGKIIARGHNLRETKKDPSCHAEVVAIRKAAKKLGDWQLIDCDCYVTLEPCIMCGGLLIQSRFKTIYFGAFDFKGGALGSSINILDAKNINHHPIVVSGILQEECSSLLKRYFRSKRLK